MSVPQNEQQQAIDEIVLAAQAWWEGLRSLKMNLVEHLAQLAVNTKTENERRLALDIVKYDANREQ
ncbi:hypothetical protein [Niveispirillum sp.]|uniref:hypothetical protein n=1 Tax=Niveispirillum sp. TaxID=1917217 RepID=UPI001B544542|nr:hypothetical protein [Niveispirillum sp.]MBP7339275.1 hypothetical protein [Niveispirillum sp.]